VKQNREW